MPERVPERVTERVTEREDRSPLMSRTEVRSRDAALRFVPVDRLDTEEYGRYLALFERTRK